VEKYNLKLTAWTVCNHNTPLGLAHREHTVHNALGDSYPHALTPASPAVRSYVRGLAKNLASQYPLQSMYIEAPNYRGRRHGHHHERDMIPLGPLENELLDISFSTHDLRRAEKEGVDGQAVRREVADHLRQFLASVPTRRSGAPENMEQFCNQVPQLRAYLRVLDQVVASLVTDVHEDIAPYGVALEGYENLASYDWLLVDAYGQTPDEVAASTSAARKSASARQRLRTGLRLGFDPPEAEHAINSVERCQNCVQAAVDQGADGVYFFNYSEAPSTYLSWIKPALSNIRMPAPPIPPRQSRSRVKS
jgi:hypothetical protein